MHFLLFAFIILSFIKEKFMNDIVSVYVFVFISFFSLTNAGLYFTVGFRSFLFFLLSFFHPSTLSRFFLLVFCLSL